MFKLAALYHFTKIDDCNRLKILLLSSCNEHEILGGLIVASEGINGTISGKSSNLDNFVQLLLSDEKFSGMSIKYSESDICPFYRLRIRISPEIITMGASMETLSCHQGQNVNPADWNRLISSPDVLLIDTRNDYEIELGSFQGAINPKTKSFRDFPNYIDTQLTSKSTKIAMYCTGGIRCEKASAYLIKKGYDHVYQLQGGILKYLEMIPPESSLWNGECYVFDQRISVGHDLLVGQYTACRGCRHVLSVEDIQHSQYLEGVHCAYCVNELPLETMLANAERHKQIQLAEQRQAVHLGMKEKKYQKLSQSTSTSLLNE
mmetsp:Transcript_17389/g.17474  ORF Transcript_17389/g.17474 Transcript_17389/m.17474 type:complete len:319 (+) Transcript_17389:62-1018(+)